MCDIVCGVTPTAYAAKRLLRNSDFSGIMQSILLSVYRRCVKLVIGTGLNRCRPIRLFHQTILRYLHPPSACAFGKTLYLDAEDSLNLSIHGIHEPRETELLARLVREGAPL